MRNCPNYNKIFCLLFLFFLNVGFSQTTIISPTGDGGFETGNTFALNNWTITSSGNNTRWVCSTNATGYTGNRCAYVSDSNANPPVHNYTTGTARATHLYRNVTIPAGETNITLSFSWRGQGESSYDRMKIWIVPTTFAPAYGTAITATGTAPTGRIQVGATEYSIQSTWVSTSFNLPTTYAGTTVRLVFEWTNDASFGTQPPAAIDNISLTSAIPTPPTNDECVSATSLTVNGTATCSTSTNGTTMFATQSLAGCSGTADDDVWYSFVATNANHAITVTPTTLSDVVFQVFNGACGSLSSIICVNSTTGTSLETTTLTGLTVGATYIVRVYSNANGSGQGTFNICVTTPPPPPVNDLCSNATPLPCGTTNLAGTTVNSTNTVHGTGCTMSNYGVWYTFVGDGNPTTISTNPGFDIKLSVATGSCGALTNIACTDTSPESATFTSINGTTYYVYIAHWSSGSSTTGTFTISRSCVTCPPPTINAVTNLTQTSATINWTAPTNVPSNGYQYAVTTSATPPASGTATMATTANITGLTADTVYYIHVRSDCSGDFSTWATSTFTTGYCNFSSSNSSYWISNFSTTGGSTNINRNSTYTAGGYANYSGTDVVSQILGQSFNFSTTMSSSTHGINIYVDWNNDFDFNDPGELVYASGGYVSSATGTITIPLSTSIGNHRMRVVSHYLDTNPSPCGAQTYTETEDYTVNVIAPPACSGTPSIATVSINPNTGWPSSPYIVSASGFTIASDLSFQWQFSPDGGVTWTNAGAATSTYANYNATAPASGVVHWQLIVTCTNSGQSATSTVGVFVTMTVSDVVTGCPNVVSGGLNLNGADPAPFNCTDTVTCVDLEATFLDLGNTTTYTVEAIQYNPPFAFNGLANPVSVNTDDVWSPIVNLPFDFCFFGNTYNQCVIGSNGVLTFDTSRASTGSGYSFSNNLPSTTGALFANTIYGVYHDIDPSVGGQVGWELITLSTGCRALVASWYQVPMFSNNSLLYTGMMVLYENSNVIEVYIQEKRVDGTWNGGNAIVGIQNATASAAVVAPGRNALDADWTTFNEAWRFVPAGPSIATLTWYEGAGTTGPVVGNTPVLNVCPTATTTYTAEITYTLCDGRTITEIDQTTVTVNGAKVWNGSVNTDWDVANNWTPTGVPLASDCVVIPNVTNDPIVSGGNYNGLGLNLTIQNNALLTVESNNAVTITDWININAGGDLQLNNSASLIQINNNANQGIMHMNRTASIRKLDYVYWSSPVASFSSSAISPGTNAGYIYKWAPTVANGTYASDFGKWVGGNEIMALGKGYIVRGPDAYTTTHQNYTATFVGTPNNGVINTPIQRSTYTGAPYVGPTSTMVTLNDDNWNLLGNPYPSALNADTFLTENNSNIAGFVKIWTHGTLPSNMIVDPFYEDYQMNYTVADYITYNSLGSTPPGYNGMIAAGQGFFVLMNDSGATNESVIFNNTMRSHTFNNSQFYRTTENTENNSGIEKHRIWLDLVSPTGTNTKTLVGYATGATNNLDNAFDAPALGVKASFELYSIAENKELLNSRKNFTV